MSKHSDELRNKYIQNPPEGMTADEIRSMSENDLLDMDYFLNEDDVLEKISLEPRVSIFSSCIVYLPCPPSSGLFHSRVLRPENFPIK